MTNQAHAHALRGSGIRFQALAAFVSIGVLAAGAGFAQAQANPRDPFLIESFNCADMAAYSIEKQVNLRADAIVEKCLGKKSEAQGQGAGDPRGNSAPLSPDAYGGPDVNVHPSNSAAIQSESQSFRVGNTIVITYNDLSGGSTGKGSYSTDGGTTFTRIPGDPFGVGHGTNFGDPGIVYDGLHAKWVAAFLASGCGGQGVAAWNSNDGITWATAGCAANAPGGSGDRNALWVDSNPASPFYGRIYNSYNDFSIGGGALRTTFSTDGGTTWSAPNTVVGSFERDIALGVTPNGNAWLAGMNEGGGGAANRTNIMHRSTDGAVTWGAGVQQNPPFAPPGNVNCSGNSYFRVITPQIRHMGWGQPAGGPNNVVHYAYAAHGTGADEGDIFYVRSTDLGATWSVPLQLNTDATLRAQWMPSVNVTGGGAVFVKWYDRRDTANNDYWIYGRASLDNGVTWQADQQMSDAVIPQPIVQTANCYMGDYDFWNGDGNVVQGSWTDSRGVGSGGTQDVFHDSANLPVGLNVTPGSQNVCAPANAVYNVAVTTFFTSNVTLSASGNPAGTTTSFVPNPVTPPGNSTFTIGNTAAGAPGSYQVNILGTAGAQTSNQSVTLNLYNAVPGAVTLTSPPNGATNVALSPTFTWAAVAQAATYDIQVATDAGFTNIVASATGLTQTQYSGATLNPATQYFWHVRALNTCGTGAFSATFNFVTLPPTATCLAGSNYTIASGGGGVIVPGTVDTGNHVDDGTTNIALPFTVALYDQTFNSVNVGSNGNAQFISTDATFTNSCLPFALKDTHIDPHWDDLRTDQVPPDCVTFPSGCGIFTSISGVAPNRIFNIEWRAGYFTGAGTANFEVRLHENTPSFEVIYGTVTGAGSSATVGVQRDTGSLFAQFECNTGGLSAGQQLTFTCPVPVELFGFEVK
jgi:hypothetical protein